MLLVDSISDADTRGITMNSNFSKNYAQLDHYRWRDEWTGQMK
jgi:hypothetical protein